LLALLDALDIIGDEKGLDDPSLIPLVDRVREKYGDNPVLQQLNYRLQPYVLGAHGLPELKMTDLDGRAWDTTQLGNKATLIDFWATWCGPCRREIPNLVKVYGDYKDKGFEIVGVSVDDPTKTDDAKLRDWRAASPGSRSRSWSMNRGASWPPVRAPRAASCGRRSGRSSGRWAHPIPTLPACVGCMVADRHDEEGRVMFGIPAIPEILRAPAVPAGPAALEVLGERRRATRGAPRVACPRPRR
jgi:thiol-disulfide isomerase/thioredoxin